MTYSKFDSDNPNVLAAYQAETNGEYLKAIEYYKEAIAENPELGIVYKHIGNVYYRLGLLDQSVTYLKNYLIFQLQGTTLGLLITAWVE
jgi:tetratricopeptide (TPR) repeat protein